MNRTLGAIALAGALSTSCMTWNMVAWANTPGTPVAENLRYDVMMLFIVPTAAADVALLPFQALGGFYPYGDLGEPAEVHTASKQHEEFTRKALGR